MNVNRSVVVAVSVGAGVCFLIALALYQNWFFFNFSLFRTSPQVPVGTGFSKRPVGIYVPRDYALVKETRELIWPETVADKALAVARAWANLLDEEGVLDKRVSVQSTSTSADDSHLFISFDRPPFTERMSTTEKLYIIESLLKTLRSEEIGCSSVTFLVHHVVMHDPHLDFSQPWPVAGFFARQTGDQPPCLPTYMVGTPITIMLDPAGDAQNTGRVIDDTFERGLTLACAQEIKHDLEKNFPGVRIVLSRVPGETVDPLQSASFANKLKADLFVHLGFYQEKRNPCLCSLFFFSYDATTDFWPKKTGAQALEPYYRAHLPMITCSAQYALLLHDSLADLQTKGSIQLKPVICFPCRPLIGVRAPVIGCEMGLNNKDSWKMFVQPIVAGIGTIISALQQLS